MDRKSVVTGEFFLHMLNTLFKQQQKEVI